MNESNAAADRPSFSLVAWNVFQGLHHRSRPRHMRRNEDLISHIIALDADVMVLPESWYYHRPNETWAEDLAVVSGYELHQWISPAPSRPRDICPWRMAIFTRIRVERLEDHVLSPLSTLGRRALVRVRLLDHDVVLAGAHLYGIHALKRGTRPWMRERRDLREAAQHNDIIAGDMNMWGPIVRRDVGDLRQAVIGRTFPAGRPHSQIDHILVNDRIEVLNSTVLPDLGSDHRGLMATLQVRDR